MVKIGIDFTAAYEQGAGIGRLVREQVRHLMQLQLPYEYHLWVAGADAKSLEAKKIDSAGSQVIWHPTQITPRWWMRIWHRLHIPYPIEAMVGRVDLYHATDFVLPPKLPMTKTILTVHDLSFERVPEAASPSLRVYLQKVVPASVKRALHVIADSEATKQDLIELYGTPADKISVILSGVDPRFQPVTDTQQLAKVREKYNIDDRPYLFSIGTVQPRKNYSRIIEALAQVREQGHDIQLVIAGGRGWLEDEMYDTIKRLNIADHVNLIGFADDVDIPALYSSADCVLFPSLYEGFGFPVLEGMACGTPVITANVSSLPEVAGDSAIMVNPYDVDEIENAIIRVLTESDLRQSMITSGFTQAQKFTWQQSALALSQVYERVLDM